MKIFGRIAVPAVLCGIALMGIIADTWLVRAATRGNGMTSDPGYYERALAWDDQLEAKAAATRLGVAITADLARQGDRDARLCVAPRDAAGAPLDATHVVAAASANLCARGRVEVELARAGDVYCASIAEPCVGVWVIDVRAQVKGETVAATARAELGVAP